MANKAYNQAQRGINKNARTLEKVRESGYGGLDKAIGKLYQRLQTTQRGYSGTMTEANRRQLDLILARTARSRKENRRMTHATTKQLDAYRDDSGILGNVIGQMQGDVKQANRGVKSAAKGAVEQVRQAKQTGQDVMGIIKSSAREQQANANQLAADALAGRTREDASLIAQQQHDLAMSKVQQQYAMAQMEKQHELALKQLKVQAKLAEGTMANMPGGLGVVKQQIDVASSVAQKLYQYLQEGKTQTEALQQLVKDELIDPEDANSSVVKYLARALSMDTSKGLDINDFQAEITHALELMPAFAALSKKQKEKLTKYISAHVQAGLTGVASTGGGDGDNFFDWIANAFKTYGSAYQGVTNPTD